MKTDNYKNRLLASRCAYLGLAAIWWFVNKQNIILSEWDAHRINVPIFLYLGIPILALLLYAIKPTSATWAFVTIIFSLGYGLHVYKSLMFDVIHMGVKTDKVATATQMAVYLLVFAVCSAALYMSGPCLQKKYGKSNV